MCTVYHPLFGADPIFASGRRSRAPLRSSLRNTIPFGATTTNSMSGAGWGGLMRSKRTHSPTLAKALIVKAFADDPKACTVPGILRLEQLAPVHVETVSSKMLLCPDASAGPNINTTVAPTVASLLVRMTILLSPSDLSPLEKPPPPDAREVVRVPVDDEGREIAAKPA